MEIKLREGITFGERGVLTESSIDEVGFTVLRQALTKNPMDLAQRLLELYQTSSTVSRVINQVVEQVMADANIRAVVPGPDAINEQLAAWWQRRNMTHLLRRTFKEFLIAGEVWLYVPRLTKREGVAVHALAPWNVVTIEGVSADSWQRASYVDAQAGANLTLTPENTAYIAHDALFGSLRGITPFASLYFAVQTYEDWLQGRVRINRLAGNVIGKMKFSDARAAADSLPNASLVVDEEAGTEYLQVDGPVRIPKPGTMAVLIGDSDFELITPNVGAATARDDGEAIWRNVVEASRLPEFLSGWGRGVNVATARVQYPFAVRMMLALRDEFDDAVQMAVRLVLRRMVEQRLIPPRWKDEEGNEWTPETAPVDITWPEIRELDFDAISKTVLGLLQLGVIGEDEAMYMLGWDKTELERVAQREGLVQQVARKVQEALDEWLERKIAEGADTTEPG